MSHTSPPTLWIESPDLRVGPVARVALLAPVDKIYSYAVPDELASRVAPGKRLMVPFGRGKSNKSQPGFCLSIGHEPWTNTLRPVTEVLDDEPLFADTLIELGQWIARYYMCPTGKALAAMAPEAIRKQAGFKTIRRYQLIDESADAPKLRSAKQQAVVDLLCAQNDKALDRDDLMQQADVSSAILRTLVKAGRLSETTRKVPEPAPNFDQPGDEPVFELNPYQRDAIGRITELANQRQFRTLLIHGVSGSGKTEIYIHTIRAQLQQDRQAILLVPEIALTTQIVERLASRFEDVAVIHSGLTNVQRSLTWAGIARGEKRVIIGTRSAVFAPCPNLGLIVVDEEQDTSYKNQQMPRFHTRDVAIKRAQLEAIPIVLGSATPSLETWQNCTELNHFEKISLPERVGGLPMPAVRLVDMSVEQKERPGIHLISREMEHGLKRTLDASKQAVLFLNRRGYANYLVCARCRTPVVCPRCQAFMVFHQTTGKAVCHHCQAKMIAPSHCNNPSCQGTLVRFGMGTQRVEEELLKKFPQARVYRADSDTMNHASDYADLVRRLELREIDVLIGTQMIAKGLDFPQVTFVGVINADTSPAMTDFRAAERTFQLVTQVAGRAGRADALGSVVVQSLSGSSPALRSAMQHDYHSFASHELALRRQFNWPPYSRLARVVVSDPKQSIARDTARTLVDAIKNRLTTQAIPAEVLGPQTSPLSRIKNAYRFDFLIRAARAGVLMQVLDDLREQKILTPMTRRTLIDVDPLSLL